MRPLLVSFVGPSGTGKSTCHRYAAAALREHGYAVHRCDVAEPLRRIQAAAYAAFGLPSPGDPDTDCFRQDGRLLASLAQHFEQQLGPALERLIQDILTHAAGPTALINTDCRNNAYPALQKLGFTFIRIETLPDILAARRRARGDLTPYDHAAAVEQTSLIAESYRIGNDDTLADLETRVRAVMTALAGCR